MQRGRGNWRRWSYREDVTADEQVWPKKISRFLCPDDHKYSQAIFNRFNLRGPNLAMVTACTTGTHSIGLGARLIAAGDADAMLVGGAEMGTTPAGLGGFAAARALSTRNDDPSTASRFGTRSGTALFWAMAQESC